MTACVIAPNATMILAPSQKLHSIRKDHAAKKDVAYIITDQCNSWILLGQSLPLITAFINKNLAGDEPWSRVNVQGLFDNMNKEPDKMRNGALYKGRYRVRSVTLSKAQNAFENTRKGFENAAIVAGRPRRYDTVST